MTLSGRHHITNQLVEIREGDGVWGVQPNYYGDGRYRCTAGTAFWHTGHNEWRIAESTFAEFYVAQKGYEFVGYSLDKLQERKVYPNTGKAL